MLRIIIFAVSLVIFVSGCSERPSEEEVEKVSKYSEIIHEEYVLTPMDGDVVFLYLKQPQDINSKYGVSSVQLIRIRALQAAIKVARQEYFNNEDIFIFQWPVLETANLSNEYLMIRKETMNPSIESKNSIKETFEGGIK